MGPATCTHPFVEINNKKGLTHQDENDHNNTNTGEILEEFVRPTANTDNGIDMEHQEGRLILLTRKSCGAALMALTLIPHPNAYSIQVPTNIVPIKLSA